MSVALPAWAMERNLILQAGAGTGKTQALVTLALHLLSGANAKRRAIPPARLVALTFTEKAGAEMRHRVQSRILRLANGTPLHVAEPELDQTFALIGATRPSVEMWQRIHRDLALASIGTFHSFCAFQLRRLAPLTDLDSDFEMLDEDDARALFEDASEGHILAALSAGDPGVCALVDEFGLTSDRPSGLIELTRHVLGRLEEEGRSPRALDDGRFSEILAAQRLRAAIDEVRDSVAHLIIPSGKSGPGIAALLPDFRATAAALTHATAEKCLDRLTELRNQFTKPRGEAGVAMGRLDEAREALKVAAAGIRAAPLGRAFVDVLEAIQQRYSETKRSRNAVDFADLQRLYRDVLRDHPAARKETKSRLDALLVDEFQDTSRLQLDVVALLSESRGSEASIATADIASEVSWEPGFLCVVGDRKQSIYEFRGADVAVFTHLRELLEATDPPARVVYLQQSHRSRPRLVSLANTLFRQAMPAGGLHFQVSFTEGDALTPVLDEQASTPLVQLIEAQGTRAEEHRPDEARRIAAHVEAILHDPKERLDVRERGASGIWRKAEGRDVVLLFRRLTEIDLYRSALSERGIPHVLVGGSGFYETQEVLDAWALLRSIDDPSDAVASTALLRSPWCTLTDETISRLALTDDGGVTSTRGVTLERLLQHPPKLIDPGEQSRLDALLVFLKPMRQGLDHLGAARTLDLAFEALDYLAVIAPQPDAESIAANIEKLVAILGRLEARSPTSRGVVRTLTERIWSRHREPEAASAEESDPACVRLMTIHQAKGLEFPIVFVPDCGASDPPESSRIAYDRDLGLGLSVNLANEQPAAGPGLAEIRARLTARRRAESLRLLYVALTRARDHLIVSGVPGRDSWFKLVAALGDDHLRRVDVDPTVPLRIRDTEPASPPGPHSAADEAVRVRLTNMTATADEVEDFHLCPERYRLRRILGLGDPNEEAHGDAVTTLARTDFGRQAKELPAPQRLRALPFAFTVECEGGGRLVVADRVDLAVLTPQAARVIRMGRARSGFAATTTALALRELVNGKLPIEAAAFAGDEAREPMFEPLSDAQLETHRRALQVLGRDLFESYRRNTWERRDRTDCDRIACGYRGRCFGNLDADP